MTNHQKQPQKIGTAISAIVCWALVAGGCFLMITGGWAVITAWSSMSWPTTKGTINDVWIQNASGDSEISTDSKIHYVYSVDGKQYLGDRVYPGSRETSSRQLLIIQNVTKSKNLLVHYHPSTPSTAYLEVGVHRYTFTKFLMGTLIFSFGAVFIVVKTLARKSGVPHIDGEQNFPLDHPISKVIMASFAVVAAQFVLLFYCGR